MTNVMSEPRQWKLTKSDIFSWDIFKSEVIFFIKKKKKSRDFQNQNSLSFILK